MNHKNSLFAFVTFPGGFWFRLFRYGFHIKDKRKNPPLFSERYGYRKFYYLGNYGIEFYYR